MPYPTKHKCATCGHRHDTWRVRCAACGAYLKTTTQAIAPDGPTLDEITSASVALPAPEPHSLTDGPAPQGHHPPSVPLSLSAINVSKKETRVPSGIAQLDDVLGGGIVIDSVILLTAEPGAGKSTLLMQMTQLAQFPHPDRQTRLYASAEESMNQVAMRAQRIGASSDDIKLVYDDDIEIILQHAQRLNAALLIVDSIQTVWSRKVNGTPGSNSQIAHVITALMAFAKNTKTPVFAISHVNKDGRASGTMKLEHGGDVSLELEAPSKDIRILQARKNRHGSTTVEATFRMTDRGLEPIDPSELPQASEPDDLLLPFTQELVYLHLEAGLEIPPYLRARADRRVDFTPRGAR